MSKETEREAVFRMREGSVCVRVCVFLGRFCLLLFAHSVSSRRSCFRLFNSMEGADSEEPEE